MTRSQRTHRPISRRRRNSRGSDFQGYEDIDDENDDNIGKDSSSTDERSTELDIHLKLISLDKQSKPALKQPYLCCRPSLSIKHLCEYVAHQTTLQAEEVEILLVKGKHQSDENFSTKHPQIIPIDDELQILKGQETMAGLRESCSSSREHLILAYRQKGIIKS
ncbi:hypothetical protein OIU76_023125 [Salix suchowensis]|nr:hypothetical protein OIU76_023125 [Salix suchowensis]